MGMHRGYLRFAAAAFGIFGVAYLVAPDSLATSAGLSFGAAGRTDVRATYGGFQIGFAAWLLWSLRSEADLSTAVRACGCVIGSVLVGRLTGLVIDGDWSPFHLVGLAFEIPLTAGAIWLGRSSGSPAADPERGAVHADRLPPAPPESWDETARSILGAPIDEVARLEGEGGTGGKPPVILASIANHPRLLGPFIGFAATLAAGGVLPRRESELLALRAAWNCRSPFEWGHHVHYAHGAGISDREIADLARPLADGAWSPEDRSLLRAADELHERQDFTDGTWKALADRFDPGQLVEIPFVVGQYTMLSMVANGTGVQPEPGLPSLPPA